MDWSKRPLSKSQINYAANDVFYLCDIYEKQKELLKKLNRNDWIIEENQKITKKITYDHNLSSIYKKIRFCTIFGGSKVCMSQDSFYTALDQFCLVTTPISTIFYKINIFIFLGPWGRRQPRQRLNFTSPPPRPRRIGALQPSPSGLLLSYFAT